MIDARRYGIAMVLILSVLVLGLATNAAAQAQAGTGQIVGTVYDASGALVPKAKVTLYRKATGLTREETANDAGQYQFILLPIGVYTVTFTHPGFKTYKADVEVTVGAAVTVNATLQLGEMTQVVEVTATGLIETTQPTPDSLINVRFIQELPITGRRFQDFVTGTPTAQIEPERGGISFAGQREINGNVTIDGTDYNEPFFGGIRGGERANFAFTIPQEAISQFQVVSYGYSAELGRSTGGVMNATTKSGTNEIHGSAFLFARNGELAANDAFNRSAITNLYQEGGSLGGSIKRDRIFYFAAFEDQKNDNPRLVIFRRLDNFTPTAAQMEAACFYRAFTGCPSGSGLEQPFTQTNDALTGFGRLDFQPSSNHRFSASYHYSKNTGENAVSVGNRISPETNSTLSNNGTEGDRTNTAVGQWTAIFSPRLIMETRGQYSLENRPRTANTQQAGINDPIAVTGTTSFLPTTLDDYRIQIANNFTWTLGAHAVKFGGEFDFIHASQFFKFNQFGIFSISPPFGLSTSASNNYILNLLSVGSGGPGDPVHRLDTNGALPSGGFVSYRVNIGNGLLEASQKTIAFFVQDTWRVTPRVTLTAGFRWEGYVNPQPDVSNTALYNQVKNFPSFPIGLTVDPAFIPSNYRQYMPRLGIAWDPRGNAKTVIRANAGFFYAQTPLLLFAGPLNNVRTPAGDLSIQLPLGLPKGFACTPLFSGDTCSTAYDQLRRIGIDLDKLTLTQLGSLPPLTITDVSNIAAALGLTVDPNRGAQPTLMANNYESPRSWQASIGIEREIKRGWSVGGDFVYLNTVHLERNRDYNLPLPIVCTSLATPGCKSVDLSLRPCFGVQSGGSCTQPRPIPTLSSVQIRETNARALYRGFTARTTFRRSRFLFQAYYTLSKSLSDDDNERDAGGQGAANAFNLQQEYGFARLDVRHLLQFSGLVDLPWGFTVSGGGSFRSARPIDPSTGSFSDSNGDGFFTDRPFQAKGVPFPRDSFRDRATRNIDLRVSKKFHLRREGMYLAISADFFNLFNFANISYFSDASRDANRVYGAGIDPTGAVLPALPTFRRLTDPSFCSSNTGCYDTNDNPGSPFTVQLGIRFQF